MSDEMIAEESGVKTKAEMIEELRNNLRNNAVELIVSDNTNFMRVQAYNTGVCLYTPELAEALNEPLVDCATAIQKLGLAVREYLSDTLHRDVTLYDELRDSLSKDSNAEEEVRRKRQAQLDLAFSMARMDLRYLYARASYVYDAMSMIDGLIYAAPKSFTKKECKALKGVVDVLYPMYKDMLKRGQEMEGTIDKLLDKLSSDVSEEEKTCRAEH